ncbi:MAG: hypothetical protein ACLFRT_10660 [Actinomycetota bacterium]
MAAYVGDLPRRIRKGFRLKQRSGIEGALARALRWTIGGAILSLPLFVIPQATAPDLMTYTLVHLGALVAFGLLVVADLARLIDRSWFTWLGATARMIASGAAVVALTVGVVALVTLPTSAALRFDPSLQFLQLLSALDIAWVASATLVGVRWIAGRRWGHVAGVIIGVICVWSIWTYLDAVGFAPDGGWLVDGNALMTYVLPYDIGAAVIAIVTLILGARRTAGRIGPETS